jgi:hypothetical protein
MNKFKLLQTITASASLALCLLHTGCAGYRIGSMLPGDVKSVYVPTFVNKSGEPLIEFDTTQAAIEQIQLDGSLKVVGEADADAILNVVLTGYRLEPVSYREDIRTATQQYRLFITASFVMRRTKDQTVVAEAPNVIGKYVFDVVGDLSSSKLQANPIAARDLGYNIVQYLVEYWE